MQTHFSLAQLAESDTAFSEQILRKCVHCGFCLTSCPTFNLTGNELDSPRGRIYLIKDMLEQNGAPSSQVTLHIDRCLSCLACTNVCPSDVEYGHLVDHARGYIQEHYRRPAAERMIRTALSRILPHPRRFRIALRAASLARPLTGLAGRFPALAPLVRMLDLAPRTPVWTSPPKPQTLAHRKGRVVLLQGCAEPVLRPEIQTAAMRLLARAGVEVARPPKEVCCGSLSLHLGKRKEAVRFAKQNIDAWTHEIDHTGLDAIIVTASGCGSGIKGYAHLLRDDPDYARKAARVAALAMDISEYLATPDLVFEPIGEKLIVAWHPPCTLQHGQRVGDLPANLLRAAGFNVQLPTDSQICCGSAGTYNILQGEMAAHLGISKATALKALRPDIVATANIGCATQIELHARMPVLHLVELLDWASGGPAPARLRNRAT